MSNVSNISEPSDSSSRLGQIFKNRNRDKAHRDSASTSARSTESFRGSGRTESDEEGEHNGIKKLVPKGLAAKRWRKKQEQEDDLRASEEAARGRSVAERGTLSNNHDSRSRSRVGVEDDKKKKMNDDDNGSGDRGSLITDESDTESPFDTPPPLSTHPSHIGYLTTSSPLVQASIVSETSSANSRSDNPPRASAFSENISELAASDSTSSLAATDALHAPTGTSQRRSPSPVGRLKEALRPQKGSSPHSSPERGPQGAAATAPTRQKEKEKENTGRSRRGSLSSKIFDKQSSQTGSVASTQDNPRTTKVPPLDTSYRPQTPPSLDTTAPVIVNTPPTPTEPSTAQFPSSRDRGSSDPAISNPNVVTSPSGNMISHRRVRSGSATLVPSKLSNITSTPLTPTLENPATTPGLGGPGNPGGFFSTVFSAAQNAANTLSSSIANTSNTTGLPNGNRHRGGTQELKDIVESPEVETLADETSADTPAGEKELAVKTLGQGDLSLSHLGISEGSNGTNSPVGQKYADEIRGRSEVPAEESFNLGNRATTWAPASVAEGPEVASVPTIEEIQPLVHARSYYEPSVAGEQTPPNGSLFEGKSGAQHSGSIRSVIGHHRKRGSSTVTGAAIGAVGVASNSPVADPKAGQPKITGFAVASKKRNRDFHSLFKSVPEDDYLIEDYSCALQREILAHGRLYVSEGHLCFSSNIFGWVTTLVMSFDEIVSVEKRSTALVFKNGLMISTLHAKNIFASFTSRDSTYDLIIGIWKLGHPSLQSSLNGVSIEGTGGGDKTEKIDGAAPIGSQSGSESDSDGEDGNEVYDEDEDEDGMSFTQADGSVAGSDVAEKAVSRKPSAPVVANGALTEKGKEDGVAAPSADFPGPATHGPSACSDQETHYSKVLADEIIPAPLGKVYNLMFGQASVTWMRNWLTSDQKCLEFSMDEKTALALGPDNKVRNYSYIKPLGGSIGPKQTKCLCTETLDVLDLEKAVSVTISTQTPDVPSGNVFSVKTKYCLSWGEGNSTRLQMSCAIEWTGKSWLKVAIEKGANDGQVQYAKDIIASLKAAVSSRRAATTPAPGKGKRKGRKGRESKSVSQANDGAVDIKPVAENWGLFEPVRSIIGPVVDIAKSLLTGNILYGLLVGLLVASWFRFGLSGREGGRGLGMGFIGTPERVAAYEEIWKREESELWEWLEDRVGMDRLRDPSRMPIEAKTMHDTLKHEHMEEREMDAAIRVTEEKLKVLKQSVEKKKKDIGGDKARA